MKQELPTIPGPIGVFDSGYGGLTILSKIREALPQYDYIYLGDNARTPYGTRSFEIVYEFTLQAVTKLFEMGCHLVILACNTASAKALRSIQMNNLPKIDPERRVLGVIRPTVECIGNITQSRHIGILATAGTIKSESYPLEVHKLYPDIQVKGVACPMWVPLVENNEAQNEGAAKALWARAHEKVCKLAMLHGISGNVYNPLITDKSVKWAWKFIDHLTRRMLYMADSYVYENVFDEKCQKVIRMLREHGGRIKHAKLLNRFHDSLDNLKKVVETLMEQGILTYEMEATKTRPSKVYVLLE